MMAFAESIWADIRPHSVKVQGILATVAAMGAIGSGVFLGNSIDDHETLRANNTLERNRFHIDNGAVSYYDSKPGKEFLEEDVNLTVQEIVGGAGLVGFIGLGMLMGYGAVETATREFRREPAQ